MFNLALIAAIDQQNTNFSQDFVTSWNVARQGLIGKFITMLAIY